MASTGGLALTTTVRVIDRVHRHAAYARALAFPAIAAGLAQLILDCSALPTSPTVARQRTSTIRISPDGMRSVAFLPSRATS